MSEQNPPETTPYPTDQAHEAAPAAQPSRAARWRGAVRDRLRRPRTGIALAVAGALLVGGAGGFALGAVTVGDRGGDRGPDFRGGPGDHGVPFGGQADDERPAPPGMPGQVPPTTREDDGTTQPDPGSATNGLAS